MLRRKDSVIKSAELVLRPEESFWSERFVKEVGFEPRVKEREGVMDGESLGCVRVCMKRWCIMARQRK